MRYRVRLLTACLILASGFLSAGASGSMPASGGSKPKLLPTQETGFLNRRIEFHGATYHFQVYLPEEFRRDDKKPWPIAIFLHGRGERGAEGMWQTQIGLPMALRDHPERWPFVIVLPQCPYPNFWTDPDMLTLAMAELDQEQDEFHTDPDRTYLTGLSMGGYGAWELAKLYPKRWAAIVIASGGIFWSYAPERWLESATLPNDYVRAVGHTSIWLFHGSDDPVVPPKESEMMFSAIKADGGHVKLWIYQGLQHDSWSRAFNEPELPHWLLTHRLNPTDPAQVAQANQPFAERVVIPMHPVAVKLTTAALDLLVGEYHDADGHLASTIYRQGDQLFERDPHGQVTALEAESPASFFYPLGGYWTRLLVERDTQGHVTGLIFRDDRHEERWERRHVAVVVKKDASYKQ
jgi:dienelactone hydrolase